MTLQAGISLERQCARIGETVDVLVDRANASGGVGRTVGDAPEVDGVVHIDGTVRAGDWARVRITEADTHDLHGAAVPV